MTVSTLLVLAFVGGTPQTPAERIASCIRGSGIDGAAAA